MQPDYTYLLNKLGNNIQLWGFYDTPNSKSFEPIKAANTCVFAYYKLINKGKAIQITKKQYGCPGAGTWLCNIRTRSLEQYVNFLTDDEGLKANHKLMREWLNTCRPYQQEHENLILAPLKPDEYKYLKTVTFFVNPDQLSILTLAAQVYSSKSDPEPVIAPFGSGCMQLISLFEDLNVPQAIIGATDMAMRKYLPKDVLAFTVTKSMFERLCQLDENSFLEKPFYKSLIKSRVKL